jgi:hypothetical protein
LRTVVMRSGIGLALIAIAALLALAAFGLFIFGALQFLSTVIDPAVAAFITGGMTFMFALVILWIGIRLSR